MFRSVFLLFVISTLFAVSAVANNRVCDGSGNTTECYASMDGDPDVYTFSVWTDVGFVEVASNLTYSGVDQASLISALKYMTSGGGVPWKLTLYVYGTLTNDINKLPSGETRVDQLEINLAKKIVSSHEAVPLPFPIEGDLR